MINQTCKCGQSAKMNCCICGVYVCADCTSDLTDENRRDYCLPCSDEHLMISNGVEIGFSKPFECYLVDENGVRIDDAV